MSQDIPSGLGGRWSGAAASTVAISGNQWLGLFVASQSVMIALVLLWPRILWLPFLCDAVMAALTFLFAADRLRGDKPEVRPIWIMVLFAMALLSLGHLLQFLDVAMAEIYLSPILQPAQVSALGLGW